MKFFPSEKITYKTKLKEDEIVNRLSQIMEPEKRIRLHLFQKGDSKSYEGKMVGRIFKMTRIIRYRNSFLPIINGTIIPDFDGTTIEVKMRLHPFVAVFIGIWMGGVFLACLLMLIEILRTFQTKGFQPMLLIPFGMLLFGYVLTMAGFTYESKKTKKDLQRIFEAEITQ